MKELGKIVAAACLFEGKVYSAPPPARHDTVLRMISDELEAAGRSRVVRGEEQGFLTESGDFIRRKPAVHVAIEAGQITEPKWGNLLYSEDLW
jgi:hypothetical protein